MPYITSEYYTTTYGGKPYTDQKELTRVIQRASDVIDSLTGYKLQTGLGIELVHSFVKGNVEKATAALVEFYLLNGGYDSMMQTNVPDASIGSFNYSMKTNSGKQKENVDVPNNVISLLAATGLLYAGINTSGGGVYYDN